MTKIASIKRFKADLSLRRWQACQARILRHVLMQAHVTGPIMDTSQSVCEDEC